MLRIRDQLRDGDVNEGIIDFELIVFIVNPLTRTLTTVQVGKDGDVWDALRDSIRGNSGGHHNARKKTVGMLLWNLLNEALRECDHIDESFGAIIEPMLAFFEQGARNVDKDDRRIAAGLKNEMQAFSRQVVPLQAIFKSMAAADFPPLLLPAELMYYVDLHDKSNRIIDNIRDNADDTARLLESMRVCDDRRDAKVQFFISVTLAVFSPLSFLVGECCYL